jgi:hypothetical protein
MSSLFTTGVLTFLSGSAPAKDEEEKQKNAKPAEERREPEVAKDKENIQPAEASKSDGFNIEDFLKQDIHNDFSQVFVSLVFTLNITFLTIHSNQASGFNNEPVAAEQSAGSRFSRFFKPESPHEHRRSSIQDELIGNIIKGEYRNYYPSNWV